MANFDTNSWYQVILGTSTVQSLDGSVLYDRNGTGGAVFMANTDTKSTEQQWQLFPFNSTHYVFRTKASSSTGYMTAARGDGAETQGNTVPAMHNVSVINDDSMFWRISPWDDGTFYLTNGANGTSWHLNVKSNSLMVMTSNITAPQDGQRFTFNKLSAIDDERFSSVITPSGTSTSPPTSTGTEPPATTTAASTSAPPAKNKGLSTGAQAAIGVSIGGVALIAALIIGFLLFRRRKRRSQVPELDTYDHQGNPPAEMEYSSPTTYYDEQKKQRMPIRYEMVASSTDGRSELPADSPR